MLNSIKKKYRKSNYKKYNRRNKKNLIKKIKKKSIKYGGSEKQTAVDVEIKKTLGIAIDDRNNWFKRTTNKYY